MESGQISTFAAGDVITFTHTGTANYWGLFSYAGYAHEFLDYPPPYTTSTYTVTSSDIATYGSLRFMVATLGGDGADTLTWSCTSAGSSGAGGASGIPTDSQHIRALQISTSTLVATTSGETISSAIDGGITDGFSNDGTPTSFSANGAFINFAAEPRSDIARRTDEAFSALGYAGSTNKAPDFNKAPPRLDREWSAWADIRGTGWKVDDSTSGSSDLKGSQINATLGLGRKLDTDTLVGVVVGYENFKYDVASLAGTLKGNGETIGGYVARRFGNLRFDAALGWSNVDYNATAGTAAGSFTGSRWLGSTGLTGDYKLNAYTIEPSAKVYVLWERQTAWTDSLGTAQDGRDFSAGRVALGSKLGRSFLASNGWTLTPDVGLYGDWRFQSDTALPTGTAVANIGAGWSGRVTAELSAKALNGCAVSLDGEYGGLGTNYKIWTGQVRGSVPF
jgi:hypothetical protein